MKKYIIGAVLSIGLLVSPAFTQAAGLTTTQINAITSLLQSFGADQSVINRVSITLNHGSTNTSTVPGCAAGAIFSSTTGNDCGCPIGQVFSSMTGNACGTWTTPTTATYPPGCSSFSGFSSTTGNACDGTTPTTTASAPTIVLGATSAVTYPTTIMGQSDKGAYIISFNVTAGDSDVYIGNHTARMTNPSGVNSGVTYDTTLASTPGVFGMTTSSISVNNTIPGGDSAGAFKVLANTTRMFTFAANMEAAVSGYAGVRITGINYGPTSTLGSTYYTSNLANFKTADIYLQSTSTGLTSTQIQSILSILSSFGASSVAIANVKTILYGGTVPTTNLAPSNLTSSQVQGILSLLSSFGASSTMIANVSAALSVTTTSAPTATITGLLTIPANAPIIISGTGSPAGSSVNVAISSLNAAISNGTGSLTGSNIIQSSGSWSVNFGSLTQIGAGSYPVTVRSYPSMTTLTTGTLTVTASTVSAPTFTALSVPFSVGANDTLIIAWSGNNSPTRYEYTLNGGSTFLSTTATSWSGTPAALGLSAGTTYNFGVRSCNSAGCSDYMTKPFAVTALAPLVIAPTVTSLSIPSSVGLNDSFTISWSGNNSPTYYQYNVNGGAYQTVSGTSWSGTAASLGLSAGTTYAFGVRSCNTAGCSSLTTGNLTVTTSSHQTASALDAFNSTRTSEVPGGNTSTFHYVWNNNLQIGSSYTADVSALQTALTHEGLYTGEISGGFYNQTFSAVKAFQQKYGIDTGTTGAGFVGLKTRAKLNTLY